MKSRRAKIPFVLRFVYALEWAFGIRSALRRRCQKCVNRIESLTIELEAERSRNRFLNEQLEGYRDAFQSIQMGYQALGAVNKFDRDSITAPK